MAQQIFKPGEIDPSDPDVVEKMKAKAHGAASAAMPENLIDADDLSDEVIIGGMRCRPISAGVLAVLEMVKAPIFFGDDDESGAKAEPGLSDMMVLAYMLMTEDAPAEIVESANGGYVALKTKATTWSFGLPMEAMAEIARKLPIMMARLQQTSDLYFGGGNDPDKKK